MAANRDMTASLILRLVDRISAPLAGLRTKLSGLGTAARRVGLGFGVLAGLSFLGPLQQAAAFEDSLRQNAITAGQSGKAAEDMIATTARAYQGLALRTGQMSTDIAKAAGALFAANLPQDLIDQFLPVLAKTATATAATLEDLSSTAIALNQNLGISGPQQMADAFGALVVAGKEGRFELRDMAREFPMLTASVANLGLKGRDAVNSLGAMLQVARRGAGSSSEAANNLANFLQKITSPEAVRNFAAAGVDLKRVLADAAKKGLNPVETVIEKIRGIAKGDQFKLGALFQDTQVLNFLKAAIPNTAEYIRILQVAKKASDSVVGVDFETRSKGQLIQLKIIEERLTQIGRRMQTAFGAALLDPLSTVLGKVQDGIARLDTAFPGLLESMAGGGAVIAAVAGGLGLLGLAAAGVSSGLAVLGGAFALLASPIGIAVAGAVLFTAAAAKIIASWGQIVPYLRGWGQQMQQVLEAFSLWLDGWTRRIGDATVGAIRDAWGGLGTWFDGLLSGIGARFDALIARVTGALDRLKSLLPSIPSAPGVPAAPGAPAAPAAPRRDGKMGPGGFYGPASFQQGQAPVTGRIVVEAAPGTRVRTADAAGVVLAPINRGMMLGTA
jgi:Phage-related minor tail protein